MINLLKLFGISIFLILLNSCTPIEKTPETLHGILDIKSWNFNKNKILKVQGEWEFYRGKFIAPEADFSAFEAKKEWAKIPGKWRYKKDGKWHGSKGIGTSRLQVLAHNLPQKMGIYVYRITSAYNLYINNLSVGKNGNIAQVEPNYQGSILSRKFEFSPTSDTLSIVIHVANFDVRNGGVERAMFIGEKRAIERFYERQIVRNLFLVGAFIMIAFYHLFLVIALRRDMANAWFGGASFLIAIRALVTENYYLEAIIPHISVEWSLKLSHITITSPLLCFAVFMFLIFKGLFSKYALRIISVICVIHIIFVLITPPLLFESYLIYVQIYIVLAMSYYGYVLIIARKKYSREVNIFGLSFLLLFLTVINDILYANQIIQTTNLISFGMLIFVFSQSAMLSLRFSDAFIRVKKLSLDLESSNKNLETKVLERTKKLSESHEELNRILETIQSQKTEIESKNENITASINYANRIQKAIIPSDNEFESHFYEHFIIYEPRDIVSGDFYRIYKKNNNVVLIAADCTGHGIPGAFMSLIGSSLLDKIIIDWNILSPDSILTQLHTEIRKVLKQRETENTDGMDISICAINKTYKILSFSGAKNPLLLIRGDEMQLIKGSRSSIGGHKLGRKRVYEAHSFEIDEQTQFYMFSDGFQDQFGGEKGRKFLSKRFRNLIFEHRNLPLSTQKIELTQTLKNWMKTGNEKQNDDILVIGVRPF